MKKILIVILSLFLCTSLVAEEGMWLLTQLNQLGLTEKGLEISVDEIYHPKKASLTDAIVWLGFCSASFVSPEGLIVTNHHCGYGALQRASSEGCDYIKSGFLARTRDEEIEAKGVTASILTGMKDVTKQVLKAVKGVDDPVERDELINARITEMAEKIDKGRDDIMVHIRAMYKGKQYIQFVYKRYQDVRMVYAPPESIGKYGGDIDNWMWPRHTGDFTFMRVYMAPDGSGAEYSPDNVPVVPKAYLRVATEPLKEGDLTFILGYPGGTTRWRTSNSVAWNLKYNYPETIQNFQDLIDLFDAETQDSEAGRIKMANLRAGLANTLKNFQGNIDGMTKTDFVKKKKAFENDLIEFIESDAAMKAQYGDVLDKIEEQYALLKKTKAKDDAIDLFGLSAGTMNGIAQRIVFYAKERAKPAEERNPGFSEENVQRNADRLPLQYFNFYEPVDKAMLKRVLKKVDALEGDSRIMGLEYILRDPQKTIDAFVEDAYSRTLLKDAESAKPLFSKTVEELQKIDDPLIEMALATFDERDARNDQNAEFGSRINSFRKEYVNALLAWKGEGLYPDANGTMRFTFGNIAGYRPADAVWYKPFTTLKGVVDKNTGVEPFDMPAKLGELHAKADFGQWIDPELKDVSVAFTHRCDITGGNSGSPVMNAKGELIGLAFDGNYEAMTGDWQYDYVIQRTISVDIRYVLFVTEKFGGADFILEEMGLK